MDLTDGIWRRASRVGQMLALLAALFLAVNPHPLHAQYDGGTEHSHFGSFCEALDTEKSQSDEGNGKSNSHGDCVHPFDPVLRSPIVQGSSYLLAVVTASYVDPARQYIFTFEPPPPRFPS